MDRKRFAVSTTMLALALTVSSVALQAQGPLYDRVMVNLPYTVTVGDKTLQPGNYVIQELPSATQSNVLLIYSDNGMRFETSAMTIPTLDNKTPDSTDVILHHLDRNYYFDKIWIQGKDYGYEFPLPNNVKERQREMEAVNVGATVQHMPAQAPATTAQNTQPAPAVQPVPVTAPAAAAPAPEATPAPQPAPAPVVARNENTEQNSANREMPHTAAGWLTMLLSGGVLSGAGMMLRRKIG